MFGLMRMDKIEEDDEIGFHRTKQGYSTISNPEYCAAQLGNLSQQVCDVVNDLKQDRRDRARLFSDVKVIESKTADCTKEKKDLADRVHEVETKVSNFKVERDTSAKVQGKVDTADIEVRKMWLTIIGIVVTAVIAIVGLGLWGSSKTDHLEKQLDMVLNTRVSSEKIVDSEDTKKLLLEIKKMLE